MPFIIAIVFVSASCKKQQQDKSQTISSNSALVRDAMAYFSILAAKKVEPAKGSAVQKKVYQKTRSWQMVNRFSQINQTIDWKSGFQQQLDGNTYLFVPVKEDIRLPSNNAYEFFRFLVFFRPASTGITVSVIEVLGDKGYSFNSPIGQIAMQALKNQLGGKSDNVGSSNASVFFYDSAYKQTAAFRLNNGSWSAARISFRSDLAIRQ